jgi:hypothetical protein
MFPLNIARDQLAQHILNMTEVDFARFMYCQHMASTFISVNKLEHMIISAMVMCNRIKVKEVLRDDIQTWERLLNK